MTHVPSHGLPGSLCGPEVAPTPGLQPFPSPLPIGAGKGLCPECRRVHAAFADAWIRAEARARPARPMGG